MLPAAPRRLRVVGFDDAPFRKVRGARVPFAGVVCADTRIEGMVWGQLRRDGWNATDALAASLLGGPHLPQLHLVLLDGISFGGMNLVDLPRLSAVLGLPCVAVMRRPPDLDAFRRVIARLPAPARRMAVLDRAGPVHVRGRWTFNVVGLPPEDAEAALERLTDTGNVPEALRLAHMVGAAVTGGVSRGRA